MINGDPRRKSITSIDHLSILSPVLKKFAGSWPLLESDSVIEGEAKTAVTTDVSTWRERKMINQKRSPVFDIVSNPTPISVRSEKE
ncbi:MAG: hypothetical protein ACREAM_22930 [Blastocatellia bacterium]